MTEIFFHSTQRLSEQFEEDDTDYTLCLYILSYYSPMEAEIQGKVISKSWKSDRALPETESFALIPVSLFPDHCSLPSSDCYAASVDLPVIKHHPLFTTSLVQPFTHTFIQTLFLYQAPCITFTQMHTQSDWCSGGNSRFSILPIFLSMNLINYSEKANKEGCMLAAIMTHSVCYIFTLNFFQVNLMWLGERHFMNWCCNHMETFLIPLLHELWLSACFSSMYSILSA